MNTILTIRKRLAQGYTHVYYPWEAGADFEKQITDESWCAKSINEAIENICSERGVALIDYDMIGHSCFVWDLQEELDDRSEYLKQRFIDSFAPAQEENAHPDLCAIRVDDNPEYMGWVDRREEWNGHVLQPGTWLFPSGEFLRIEKAFE